MIEVAMDLNNELEKVRREQEKLTKEIGDLYGQSRLDNLKSQQQLLKEENIILKEKVPALKEEEAYRKDLLTNYEASLNL
jgi:hypothetical protein